MSGRLVTSETADGWAVVHEAKHSAAKAEKRLLIRRWAPLKIIQYTAPNTSFPVKRAHSQLLRPKVNKRRQPLFSRPELEYDPESDVIAVH